MKNLLLTNSAFALMALLFSLSSSTDTRKTSFASVETNAETDIVYSCGSSFVTLRTTSGTAAPKIAGNRTYNVYVTSQSGVVGCVYGNDGYTVTSSGCNDLTPGVESYVGTIVTDSSGVECGIWLIWTVDCISPYTDGDDEYVTHFEHVSIHLCQ